MEGVIYILLGALCGVTNSQYVALSSKPTKNPCDNAKNTALIEQFFNIIFTEFHNTPPVCVCIQMCPEQPTYCYPNGCLKRPKRNNVEETTSMVHSVNKVQFEGTTKSAIFVVDDHKDLLDDFLEGPGLHSYIERTEKPQLTNLIFRPNPFKEMIFKHKKPPKLEMKYNLREQVKNTKTDKLNQEKIDISKTRWPLNKHLLHGKQPFNRIRHYKKNDDKQQTKFFISMFPEYGSSNYTPVFYKKYLTKRDNNNGVNVEALYLYQSDTANFSLETLIDNLIESSLDKSKKDDRLKLNVIMDDTVDRESTTDININFTDNFFLQGEANSTTTSLNSTAVNIISMNSTYENTDVNKYLHDTTNQNTSQTFLEMITSMSKKIEKQNRASIEFMNRVTGRNNMITNQLLITTTDKTVENIVTTNLSVIESTPAMTNLAYTTEKTISSINFSTTHKPTVVKTLNNKKTKQRIVRKLKHKKLN